MEQWESLEERDFLEQTYVHPIYNNVNIVVEVDIFRV